MKEETLFQKALIIQIKEEMIELKDKYKMELEEVTNMELVEKALAGSTHDVLGPVWDICAVLCCSCDVHCSCCGKAILFFRKLFWRLDDVLCCSFQCKICCKKAPSNKALVQKFANLRVVCKKLCAEVAQWDKEESYAKAIELFHKFRTLQQEKSQYLFELDDLKTQELYAKAIELFHKFRILQQEKSQYLFELDDLKTQESYAKAIELFNKFRTLQQEKSQYLFELDDLKTQESYAKAIELFHKSRALQQEKSQYLLELDDMKTQVLSLKIKNNERIRAIEKEAREHALTKEEVLLHQALAIQSKEEMIELKGKHKMELKEEVQLIEKALAGSTHDVLVQKFVNLRIVCKKLCVEVAQRDKKVEEVRTALTDLKEIYREHINALGDKIEA